MPCVVTYCPWWPSSPSSSAPASPRRSSLSSSMLLTNARIHTMDPCGSVVDSLVIREGRVAFAGARGDVNPAAGERVLDLSGRVVLPGLVDGHGHLMLLARSRLELDLSSAGSEEETAAKVREASTRRRPGEWIAGRGWDQTRWPGQRFPSRGSLDRAAPAHPVALVRVDGHATWASGAALAQAGITSRTRDPEGGLVVKDERGEPTGLLVDLAQDLIRSLVPPPSEDRFDEAVEAVIGECLAKGLTGAHEYGLDLAAIASYTRLIERGRFPFACSRPSAARRPGASIASAAGLPPWATGSSPLERSSSGSTAPSARAAPPSTHPTAT